MATKPVLYTDSFSEIMCCVTEGWTNEKSSWLDANAPYLVVILQHLCDNSDFRVVVLDRDDPANRQRGSYAQEVEAGWRWNRARFQPHDVGGVFSIGIWTILVGEDKAGIC